MSQETATRWRFVEPLQDRSYYHDEIVQHTLLEHRAIQRTFAERVSADETVVEEIVAQVQAASKCRPPCLPLLYGMEKTAEGRLRMVFELVEGKPFPQCITERDFAEPKGWARAALSLVEMLMDVKDSGAHFDKLDIEHLVLTQAGTVRSRFRNILGTPDRERLESHPMLARLHRQPRGGIYTSRKAPSPGTEAMTLLVLLAQMANGAQYTLENFQRDMNSATPGTGTPGELLASFYGRSGQGQGMLSLHDVRDALNDFLAQSGSSAAGAALPVSSAPPPAPAPAYPAPAYPAPAYQSPAYQSPAPPAPSPALAPPQPSVGSSDDFADNPYAGGLAGPAPADPGASPAPAPGPTAAAPKSNSAPPGPLPPPPNDEEMANPWANAPMAPGTEAGETFAPEERQDSGFKIRRPSAAPSTGKGLPIGKVIAVAAVIAIVGLGGAVVLPLLTAGGENLPPKASFSGLPDNVLYNEAIPVTAAASGDPEGEALSYSWKILHPADAYAIFDPKGDSKTGEGNSFVTTVPQVTIQFFTTGENVLELRVNDGLSYSEPITQTVTVAPR